MGMARSSVSYILALFPSAQLDGPIRVNQLALPILSTLFEVSNVNCAIRIELPTVPADLVFLVLGLKDLVVGKDHAVDTMTDVGSFSELTQPLGSFLVDYLLELEVIPIEIKWFLNIFEEILYR